MATATRLCRYCKARKRREEMILVPVGAFCDAGHAFQWAQDNADRARAKVIRNRKRERAQQKSDLRRKDIPAQLRLTQAAVNKLANLLDQGKPCISCGRPDGGPRKRNASHLKSRGANSGLRFDLRNINSSCIPCNQYQSGNIQGYREGLQERYGQWILDYLDAAPRLKAWTAEELIAIRKEVNAEIKRLEHGEPPSRNWRALPATEGAA